MQGIVHILFANGDRSHTAHDLPPELDTFQSYVGGFLEEIPGFVLYQDKPCVAYANEDGDRLQLPVNSEATVLWRKQGKFFPDIRGQFPLLRGDVVVVTGDEEFMEEL